MKASAIISAYFGEQFLDGRIQNLLLQTLRPQIVVVAQEKSTEVDIAERMLDASHGDLLIQTTDVPTIYKAWNMGIEGALGEYITNANCDDRLAKRAIERLSQDLDRRPEVAVVYPDVDIVADLTGGFDYAWRTGYFRWAEGGFKELLEICFLGPMPMWRKSLHSKHGWFDEHMQSAGDYEFWLRIAKAGELFHHMRESLGIYLRRPDSAENRDPLVGARETKIAKKRYR